MDYTVKKGDSERVFHALRAAGYEPAHTAYRRGYVSRRTSGTVRDYTGGYPAYVKRGIKLVWDMPAYNTTQYHLREYWTKST